MPDYDNTAEQVNALFETQGEALQAYNAGHITKEELQQAFHALRAPNTNPVHCEDEQYRRPDGSVHIPTDPAPEHIMRLMRKHGINYYQQAWVLHHMKGVLTEQEFEDITLELRRREKELHDEAKKVQAADNAKRLQEEAQEKTITQMAEEQKESTRKYHEKKKRILKREQGEKQQQKFF